MFGVVVTLGGYILTSAGVVDTLDGRERKVNVPTGEVSLIVSHNLVEGVVSLLPSRTESDEQDGLLTCLLVLDHCVHFFLILLIVR